MLENGAIKRQIDVSIGDIEIINVAKLQFVGKMRHGIRGKQFEEIPAAFEVVAARRVSPMRELV